MSHKSVAILDVRSTEVTAAIAEKGVNHTFIFRGSYTTEYSGFDQDGFFDENEVRQTVATAIREVERRSMEKIKEIVVSVPSTFSELQTERFLISLQSARKINQRDITTLYNCGMKERYDSGRVIRHSNMYFLTSDKRRTINPIGMKSDSLEGSLCYFIGKDYFTSFMDELLYSMGIRTISYMPVSFAESMYLIAPETRDGIAILLDVDSLEHTFSIVCGNGISFQKTDATGGDHIVAGVYEKLGLPYYAVKELCSKINLSGRENPGAEVETYFESELVKIRVDVLKNAVKEELDLLCEKINGYLEECNERAVALRPILMTGGGLSFIRGAQEHISNRLNKVVEVLSPSLPYYSKESQSSLLSVLDMALNDKQRDGIVYKILNGFGGN
ncbi:MAG: hypothetical protein J5993_03545 [Clostridia bacterium]|nr:hypothetical protein [Clostridia bacterium]